METSSEQIQQLIDSYDEYVKVLSSEINSLIAYGLSHGWKSQHYEDGVKVRASIKDQISELSKQLNSPLKTSID